MVNNGGEYRVMDKKIKLKHKIFHLRDLSKAVASALGHWILNIRKIQYKKFNNHDLHAVETYGQIEKSPDPEIGIRYFIEQEKHIKSNWAKYLG